MTDTVTVKAKTKFTTALASGLIIHMRPDMKKFATRSDVPIADAVRLHNRKWIEDFEGLEEAGGTPTAARPAPAASGLQEPEKEAAKPFTAKHVGGGRFEITGPGIEEPIKIVGKAAAHSALDELNTAYATTISQEPGKSPPDSEGSTDAGSGVGEGDPDEAPAD